MKLNQAQQIVDDWINEYGVRYFNELTNTVILMEEVGEVARIVARQYGEQSEKESDKGKNLADEIADVQSYLLRSKKVSTPPGGKKLRPFLIIV